MVLEVQMQDFGNSKNSYPCIIQYVLFPPHVVPHCVNATLERTDSGTDDDTEEGKCTLIAIECIYMVIYTKSLFER